MIWGLKGSRQERATPLLPSERASKIMGIEIENLSFDELEPEISWDKGVFGIPSGGILLKHSGAPW